jgi:hypothetical protein
MADIHQVMDILDPILCPEIIATTDKDIKVSDGIHFGQPCPLGLCEDDGLTYINLPKIPSQFIKKYVESFNDKQKIEWVNVKYDCDHNQMPAKVIDVLRVDEKNYITINDNKIQYTTEEVIDLISRYREFVWKNGCTIQEMNKFIATNIGVQNNIEA